jgi:transposase-like protein
VKIADKYHPKVGDTWIADETVLRVAGQNVWMYDIIDRDTRFLLATRFAISRTSHNAEMLMKEASQRANGQIPKTVITDANSSYPDGIEMAFGSQSEHIQSRPFAKEDDTQRIERWHETLKERTKIMKGLKSLDSGMAFIDGFLVYYNYFRPNEALDGKTPAESAGIKFPYKNWAEIINQPVSKQTEIKSHIQPRLKLITPKERLPVTHIGHPRTHVRIKVKSEPIHPSGGVYADKHGSISRRHFRGSHEVHLGAGVMQGKHKRHLRLG